MNISMIFQETLNDLIMKTDLWLHYYMCLIKAKNVTQNNYIKTCEFVNNLIKDKTLNYGDFEDLEYLLVLIDNMEDTSTCMEKHINDVLRYIFCIVSNIRSLPTQLVGNLNITMPQNEHIYSKCIAKLRECKSNLLFKDKSNEIKHTKMISNKNYKRKIQ